MIVSSLVVIAAMVVLPVAPDVTGIEKAFSNYNRVLVEKKYEELTRYIQVPFVIVDSAPRIITDIDVVIAGLRSTRESLDEKGYANSVPAKARVSVLSSDRVLVNRIIRHYKKDGSLLETRANFYLMTKASGEWKISGVIPQEGVYVGKIY